MAAEQQIVELLGRSIDPSQQKDAEKQLLEAEKLDRFAITLLTIVGSGGYQQTSRLAAALYFKNFVRRKWVDPEGNHLIPQDDVALIKRELVGLMISSPPSIQSQLGDAIGVIADSDFWERWDTLIDDLVSRLTQDNPQTNDGVLRILHSILKRWRPLTKSDALYTEINHVLDRFVPAFLGLLQNTNEAIEVNANNEPPLKQNVEVLITSIKVLHDLCCHDVPDALVENFDNICILLNNYLVYDNSLLHTDDETEPGQLEYLKSTIWGFLIHVTYMNTEDIERHVGQFLNSTSNFLITVPLDTKYDLTVSRALIYLTTTSMSEKSEMFVQPKVLGNILEQVIIPNIGLREADEEMFEDEPIEYIRKDLEGTDAETRRRAATDFLRKLNERFSDTITTSTMQYVNRYLEAYAKDQSSNWKDKDVAVYLFCSIAALGNVTALAGVRTVNPHVNMIEFFQQNIAQDLISDSSHAILQVDAIKYLYMFRSHMSSEQWQEALPLLARHLGSSNYVVHTYCAIAIERILALTDPKNELVIPRALVSPSSKDMIRQLFLLIQKSSQPAKLQENEFLMRCIMRILMVCREDTIPHADFVLNGLVSILRVIRHNPSNPRFYYYLFESLGALVKHVAHSQPQKFEDALSGPFFECLEQGITEFMPYIFQLFASLLDTTPAATLSENYTKLIAPVVSLALWEDKTNPPALTHLLCSLINKGTSQIIANNQVEPILGIFQFLISRKPTETLAFDLLESCLSSFPAQNLEPYWPEIFKLILTRLNSSKTEYLTYRFTRLYHCLSARQPAAEGGYGADFVARATESLQSGIFPQLYLPIVLPNTAGKFVKPHDRKLAIVSFTRTLTSSTAFAERYAKGWGITCEHLLKMLVDPPTTEGVVANAASAAAASKASGKGAAADGAQQQDEQQSGMAEEGLEDAAQAIGATGFTQLTSCRPVSKDPYPEFYVGSAGAGQQQQQQSARQWVGACLREANQTTGGRIEGFVGARIENAEVRSGIAGVMGG
ncbi:MAG: importin-alpha export receptor [Alyxoria varia]|nr:MAG: importin-alpha export receptor [Alyxoria varia]